ncbi:thiamine pyrophosphate-binding protein [Mucilaginibacter psychrotolerans]|uniref:Thiamine pyrophosphate-binding protein n=1 Tax=Mucilaginibacter psychrotolerans TaxID=1524096 RepID=A0A4Y8SA31_9SPHI|nr:thiamine pyrophosphate-binding protein [Mucilaginibacter psychrotolerans]TFF35531.1 thiamine pyrophosphate-binding protein [Mucilaginibacter psychrotolerans]
MKASDFVATFLEKKGVKHVFELSGGMITHLLDSLNQKTAINIITMHHEQSAAFAADAYGRVTGVPGVALATSGPGATNLLTGIGSCYFDSTPAVFITGQVNRHEQKGDRNIRQLGFQETDIIAMATPITKACFKIVNEHDLPAVMERAFEIAMEGRPGPVLVDIPMDVQRAQVEPLPDGDMVLPVAGPSAAVLQDIFQSIKRAKRPVLLVGRGVRAAFAKEEMEAFLQKTKLPVITTLLAVDAVEYDHPSRVGFIGSYGNRWANIAFGECDLLIVVGSRLDIRQTGADTKFFENRTIYHIDCEAAEINNRVKGCVPVVADAKQFFIDFNKAAKVESFKKPNEWIAYINTLKVQWPDIKELSPAGINPNYFMHTLSHNSRAAKCYVADVGSHQMWAAQSVEIYKDQLFLTSAGMGAMGYALPAGIGACFALNLSPVVVIVGDGCMQINIQELQTIVRNKLPVKIVVMNNKNLGMIRQFQDSYFESRYQSTYWGYSAPDFEKVAKAYGMDALTISAEDDMEDAVKWMWNDTNNNAPVLLQVMIDPHTNTYPKIAFGKPITEMEPFAKPIEMEST